VDRLYSKFPAGSVGLALLFLRLTDGLGLASQGWQFFTPMTIVPEPMAEVLLGLALVASAILLILGLRTTLAGTAGACCTAASALYGIHHETLTGSEMVTWFFLFALVFVLSGSLALTGPGGYSLDARLSGWRKIKLSSGSSNGSTTTAPRRTPTEWETLS
jgi:uncharacterized membrane protein YphA (DoxX/SURF4 family)